MLRRLAYVSAVILLALLAVLFTVLNPQQSAGLALLIAFSAGLLAGALWRSTWIARLLAERGRLRHALRLAESRRDTGPDPTLPDAG
jgi:hypothetical protein